MFPSKPHDMYWPRGRVLVIVYRYLFMVSILAPMHGREDGSEDRRQYVIVFDAGSTGSRIHIYKFLLGDSVVLENEEFFHIKPGLSSYIHQPKKCVTSLGSLLDKAVTLVPQEKHATTMLTLKATAGLRLAEKSMAQAVLNEVLALFKQYPFNVTHKPVEILSGLEEGVLGWIAVNFLQGALNKTNSASLATIGAIDLGGASIQVTYRVNKSEIANYPPNVIQEKHLLNQDLVLYTRSYLGYGLKYSRLKMFGGKWNPLEFKCTINSSHITSSCLPVNYSRKWLQGGTDYTISGHASPAGRSSQCLMAAHRHVHHGSIQKLSNLKTEVYGFSYLYDVALLAGIIGAGGGGVPLTALCDKAESECNIQNIQHHFLCTDLSYMCVLLREGFGLPENFVIQLIKKIRNYELSWALGAALMSVQN